MAPIYFSFTSGAGGGEGEGGRGGEGVSEGVRREGEEVVWAFCNTMSTPHLLTRDSSTEGFKT